MCSIACEAVISSRVQTSSAAIALLLFAGGAAAPALAQEQLESGPTAEARPITLEQLEEEALSGNVGVLIAEEQARIAVADESRARSFLWPEVGIESGVIRSTDPVFAFGTKLRQARFTESDFELDVLNDPDPIEDWSAQVDVRWRVLSPTRWMALSAAGEAARSAEWITVRTREMTLFWARELYFNAIRTAAHRVAAEATEKAASATVERFRRRRERGLLTEADQLQAEADLATARADRVDRQRAEFESRQELGSFLGWPPDVLPVPIDTLVAPTAIITRPFDAAARPDVRSLEAAWSATRAERRRATLAFIPAIDAFGGVASHSEDILDSESTDWSVGVVLRWPAFTGFRLSAELDRAHGEERIARRLYEQARRDAEVEVDQAIRAVLAAEERVKATEAARRAGRRATELMRRRFEEGLATPSDLLISEARLSTTRGHAIDALTAYHVAVARAEFVQSQVGSEEDR